MDLYYKELFARDRQYWNKYDSPGRCQKARSPHRSYQRLVLLPYRRFRLYKSANFQAIHIIRSSILYFHGPVHMIVSYSKRNYCLITVNIIQIFRCIASSFHRLQWSFWKFRLWFLWRCLDYLYVDDLGRFIRYYWCAKGKGYINSDDLKSEVSCIAFYFYGLLLYRVECTIQCL